MIPVFGPETYNQFNDGSTGPKISTENGGTEGGLPVGTRSTAPTFGENVNFRTTGEYGIPPELPPYKKVFTSTKGTNLKTTGEGDTPVLPPGLPPNREYYYDPRFYTPETKEWKTSPPTQQPPVLPRVDPPDVSVPPNPCINLHDYGHVLWDYGFQWQDEIISFAASPTVTRISAFDDMSFNTLVGVRNNEFSYLGKKFKVVCTGYYIRDYLCDVTNVSYSTISSFNVSVAKFTIPKLGGDFYITTNGKLCKLDIVPEGENKTPDIGTPGTPPPYQPPILDPSPPLGSGQVYGTIYAEDIINDVREVCTKELWCRGTSSLQNHFRDVTSSLDDVDFIMDVWDNDPNNACKCYNYRILYGDYEGKGAVDLGGLDSETMTKAIYSMYAKVLLPHQQTKFVIDGNEEDYIYVIDVRRNRYGTAMDPGNWELNLGRISSSIVPGHTTSGSISFISWASTGSFIDGSINSGSVHLTNKVYQILQGTLEDGITTTGSIIGEFYPNHGTMVLAGSKMDSLFNFNTNRNVQKHGLNTLRLFTSISGASAPNTYTDSSGDPVGFKGRKLNINHSKYVFVRVKNQLFNFSNNPTFVTGSTGEIIESFKGLEKAWITTVGLYNPQKELLAVAKLPKPYLKSSTEEALFTIKVGQSCCR